MTKQFSLRNLHVWLKRFPRKFRSMQSPRNGMAFAVCRTRWVSHVLRVVDTAELCPHSPVKSTRKIRQLPGQLASLLSATGNYYAMLIGLDRLRTRSVRKPRAQANEPGQSPKDVAKPPSCSYTTRAVNTDRKKYLNLALKITGILENIHFARSFLKAAYYQFVSLSVYPSVSSYAV